MSTPQLCVTVTGSTTAELRARRNAAAQVADLVELRLDGVRDADVSGALEGRTVPVLVTCRPVREGGAFDGAEEERLGLLRQAQQQGAEYVDVEFQADHREFVAARDGRGVVLSMHDFAGVPRGLAGLYRAMRATGAEVVKLAVTARSLCDNLPLVELGRDTNDGVKAALVAMGTPGWPSRILAPHFGSCWSYAGEGVAPGQMAPGRLLSEFRFRAITPRTRVFAIVGRPIAHSVSPAMHNAAFEATGIDAVFVPLEASSADDFERFARAIGVAGASVTVPFKVDLMSCAAEVDTVSLQTGALNTLKADGLRWVGRNADVSGFLAPLVASGIRLGETRVSILGAGGAARAAVRALADAGARVTVWGRTREHVERVAALAVGTTGRLGLPEPSEWDLLVNATPIGMHPNVTQTPLAASRLARGRVVYDLVYNPAETRLLREAAAAGCRTIGGLEMLVSQACVQFEWWTGVAAPRHVMQAAAVARLNQMAGIA
ncbi:MAG TPA: shikimate dehydrogenase [Vicinamibacterales bacterium]|jgi:3-dehydroquinate dehydratase/shikimate dehydrogenase